MIIKVEIFNKKEDLIEVHFLKQYGFKYVSGYLHSNGYGVTYFKNDKTLTSSSLGYNFHLSKVPQSKLIQEIEIIQAMNKYRTQINQLNIVGYDSLFNDIHQLKNGKKIKTI